jgi:hypothetical protein
MHKYIYLFIIFLLYQTSSFSKISDVNKFDQKNLSNYFSAVLSINNNDAKNSLKFLENSKILNDRHEEHFKNYIKSLVANEKVDLAIKKIKYSQNNYSFLEREVILLVDNLINKNLEKSTLNLEKIESLIDPDDRYHIILSKVLKNYLEVFKNNNIESYKNNDFAELDDISLAFLSCYFDLKNTTKRFEEFIEYDGSSSRYIYFYLDYLIEQNKIKKIDQVLQNINQLNKPLLIAQSVKWIEEKNYNKLNDLFSCKNEKDIIAEFFYLIANLYSSQGLYKESNFYIILAKYLNPNFTLNSTLLIENYMDTKKYKLVKNELSNIEKDNVIYNWFKVKKNASIIQETKNDDSALKFIKKEYRKIQNPSNKILFDMANILRNFQDYEGAIEIYSNLIRYPNYSAEEYADLLYKRGTSYERKKDFLKADEDLIESLKIDPDEPYVLNYLGYSWLERSYKIPEAMDMLKEAYSLRENDPYITDSIGWAYYLIKDFVNAKKYLEKAVKLMPYDPIVNDHYGDVLWRLNKKVQARYFWNGVLKLEDTEEELKKEIEKKLVFGL